MLGFVNEGMTVNSTLELLGMVFEGSIHQIPEGNKVEVRYVDGDYLHAPILTKTLYLENRIDCEDGVIRTAFWQEKGRLYFNVLKDEERFRRRLDENDSY